MSTVSDPGRAPVPDRPTGGTAGSGSTAAGSTAGTGSAAAVDHRYAEHQTSEEFRELKHRFRSFVFPMTVAFLAWYFLYVLMSAYARDFMSQQVVGNVNVALVFGLLQFVSTFLITFLYSRFAASRLDPLASRIRGELEEEGLR